MASTNLDGNWSAPAMLQQGFIAYQPMPATAITGDELRHYSQPEVMHHSTSPEQILAQFLAGTDYSEARQPDLDPSHAGLSVALVPNKTKCRLFLFVFICFYLF